MPAWKHAAWGFTYGAMFGGLLLAGGFNPKGDTPRQVIYLAILIPLLFSGLALLYRDEFWERALFKNKETRKRMLGWLLGIILILILFRFF